MLSSKLFQCVIAIICIIYIKQKNWDLTNVEIRWKQMKNNINRALEEITGWSQQNRRKGWWNEECAAAVDQEQWV